WTYGPLCLERVFLLCILVWHSLFFIITLLYKCIKFFTYTLAFYIGYIFIVKVDVIISEWMGYMLLCEYDVLMGFVFLLFVMQRVYLILVST
ncbi:hypothetical protein ACJX0J_013608, partial [Zea mays]